MGALGPVLLVLTASLWFFLIIAGFALPMHALAGGFSPPLDPIDAAFASASAFLTLGSIGHDVQTGAARALVVGAALCGFGLVPLVVTFLLNVQGALTQREEMVLRVSERDRSPPSGAGILEQHGRLGAARKDSIGRFFEDWDRWCAHVLLTHRAFPILAYFRSTDRECDWLAALGAVLDAAALLAALERDAATERAILCHRIGSRLVNDLAATFHCVPTAASAPSKDRFDEVCDALRRAGYGVEAEAATFDSFESLRAQHGPALASLCRHFGVQRLAF